MIHEIEDNKNGNEGQHATRESEVERDWFLRKNDVGNKGRRITEVEQMSAMKTDRNIGQRKGLEVPECELL